MKKLLFVLCALAAIALLTPSAGFAQWQNRIGIYTTNTAGGTSINPAPNNFSQFTVYFILTNPTQNDVPMTSVKGWEYLVTITGNLDGLVRLADTLPAGIINVGDANDPYNAVYQAGLATPIPVTPGVGGAANYVVLHSWTFLMTDRAQPYYFYLSPPPAATFPGRLAFLNSTNGKLAADPSQDVYTNAVFAIGDVTTPVAIQSESFGGVKALFR